MYRLNVYDATQKRLKIIFDYFDYVYVSFSGGKDSSVMLQLANMVAKEKNKKFDVLFIYLEGNYQYTIDHVNELKKLSQINEFYWVCLPLVLRNAVSQLSIHWICWDKRQKEFWIRDMPKKCINETNYLTKYG